MRFSPARSMYLIDVDYISSGLIVLFICLAYRSAAYGQAGRRAMRPAPGQRTIGAATFVFKIARWVMTLVFSEHSKIGANLALARGGSGKVVFPLPKYGRCRKAGATWIAGDFGSTVSFLLPGYMCFAE